MKFISLRTMQLIDIKKNSFSYTVLAALHKILESLSKYAKN